MATPAAASTESALLRARARGEVWLIFHHRWLRWDFRPEMEAEDARPVLSFLYRTCHFVVKGFRRRGGREEGVEKLEAVDEREGAERRLRQLEAGRCLDLARRICPPEELDVLLPKLLGVSARAIATTLGVTEPVVDHRFRGALARLQAQLSPKPRPAPVPPRPAKRGGRRG
jgi:DNA-directed RNA polymerase specialized sigma24 family protein